MPITTGFNHVATITADLDRLVHFYANAFGGEKTFEMAATGDHPRMAIIGLLIAIIFLQYRTWTEITEIRSEMTTIPARVTETQKGATEAKLREELRAIRTIFGL
jgi:catechol 2,3-dioxygenase-like lactoylglutathione lyase family enzyme